MVGDFRAKGNRAAAWAVVAGVRLYQRAVSPLLPPRCRFWPTCSSYVIEAVTRFGVLKGGWLGLRRIVRCHPWGGCGCDPVPDEKAVASDGAAATNSVHLKDGT